MTVPPEQLRARRVLLALAAGGADTASLRAGVQLAAVLSAELEAVFLEDADLFRLCALPFAREILPSGVERPVGAAALSGALRAQAETLRRRLAVHAEPARIKWSFRTLRMQRASALLELAAGDDVVVAAWQRRILRPRPPGVRPRVKPVVMAYESAEPPAGALKVASQLALRLGAELVLLCPPGASGPAPEPGLVVRQVMRTDVSMPGLLAALVAMPAELLVLPADEVAAYAADEMGRLLDAMTTPVVFAR